MTGAPIDNINRSHLLLPASRFHYDIIKRKYGEKSHLLFRDTHSLMYEIETPDLYKDMIARKEHFDLSNIDTTNHYYQPYFGANKAVVWKIKEEESGNPISEIVGLRPENVLDRECVQEA